MLFTERFDDDAESLKRLGVLGCENLFNAAAKQFQALGAHVGCRRYGADFDLRFRYLFKHAQMAVFARLENCDGSAATPRAPGAADAVNIGLVGGRDAEIDDVRKVLKVDPARSDVGRNEHVNRAALEALERGLTLFLRLVAVNGVGIDTNALERTRQASAGDLRVDEDKHLRERTAFGAARLEHIDENVGLVALGDAEELLRHGVGRRIFSRHFDDRRIVAQEIFRETLDFGRESRREEQTLAIGGQKLQDARNVGQEPHVEHAVGFVEHDHFDLRKVHGAAFDMVEESPGRRGEHFNAATQHVGLRT